QSCRKSSSARKTRSNGPMACSTRYCIAWSARAGSRPAGGRATRDGSENTMPSRSTAKMPSNSTTRTGLWCMESIPVCERSVMLDLDKAITGWREAMARGGVVDPAVLDELESHLRDFIAEEVQSGRDVESALHAGLERIGPPGVLRREFSRANPAPILAGVSALLRDRRKCVWTALALSMFVAAVFYD